MLETVNHLSYVQFPQKPTRFQSGRRLRTETMTSQIHPSEEEKCNNCIIILLLIVFFSIINTKVCVGSPLQCRSLPLGGEGMSSSLALWRRSSRVRLLRVKTLAHVTSNNLLYTRGVSNHIGGYPVLGIPVPNRWGSCLRPWTGS